MSSKDPFPALHIFTNIRRAWLPILLLGLAAVLPSQAAPYAPNGSVPASLAPLMPPGWDLTNLPARIWVAPGGTGTGSAPNNALGSIQAALNLSQPGTLILVQAGTYTEKLTFPANGTDTQPIVIVSADGLHQATIQYLGGDDCTITGSKNRNIAIIGMHIVGSGDDDPDGDGDNSPIKYTLRL